MKTKNNSILFFVFLIATAFYFNSCKPDETPACGHASNTTVNLTPDELAKVPYTGFDTLYFKAINGDTNIVVGTGKQFYYDVQYTSHGGPDCPQDVANYQAYKIQFNPIRGDLRFTFKQQRIDWSININKSDYSINFYFSYYQLTDSTKTYQGIPFDKSTNTYIDNSYACSYTIKNGITYIKSQKENEEYSLLKK